MFYRILMAIGLISSFPAYTLDWPAEADAAYVKSFEGKYAPVENPPAIEAYATAKRYDDYFMAGSLEKVITEQVQNDNAMLAWSTSYRMMSLNYMYRATGDEKYLQGNLRLIRAVLAQRDDKRGKKLWTGQTCTVWGCDKYAKQGRSAFACHTGMALYPMLDCMAIIKDKGLNDLLSPDERNLLTAEMLESLAWHDVQWRDGPEKGEGYYIGKDQEPVCEGIPLPANRLSAMGRALWKAWEATGDTQHRDRALALGRYIKNRLYLGEDGGYYWTYWLPEPPTPKTPVSVTAMKGNAKVNDVIDDTSHGSLTVSFPLMLAQAGEVFTQEDVSRFAIGVTQGFGRLGNGRILGCVTGDPGRKPVIGNTTIWLDTVIADPAVESCLFDFFLHYIPKPGPFDLSRLLMHRAK